MIFERLVLQNFRAFRGRHEIDLRPASEREPVILFMGLNGAGKTSLLEALYLALYGKLSPSSRRNGKGYEAYLESCIHQGIDPADGASIELTISRRLEGATVTLTLRRSWWHSGNAIREELSVRQDDHNAPVLGEEWAQFIEELLPSKLAPLFFFDGEKIEALADLDATAEVLSVAIHSLLGLDLVDRLGIDLEALERRNNLDLRDEPDRTRLEQLEQMMAAAKQTEEEAYRQRSSVRTQLERAEEVLRRSEKAFAADGGDAFERREMLEAERTASGRELTEARHNLELIAAGPAPLLLVKPLLRRVRQQAQMELETEAREALVDILKRRNALLLERLAFSETPQSVVSTLQQLMHEEQDDLRASGRDSEVFLKLSPETRHRLEHLLEAALDQVSHDLTEGLDLYEAAQGQLEIVDRRLASVPEEEAIRGLREARDRARWELERLAEQLTEHTERYEAAVRERKARERALASEMENQVDREFAHEDAARVVEHSRRVRATLSELRKRVLERHVQSIGSLVLDGFRTLLRKEHLIEDLEIDPEDFSLRLWGPDGRRVDPTQLSAGERQLLAVALLWGLARAAGRGMPTLIDTPLGRLDSSHRLHLVERYFPNASHQVILLSTDEEIRGHYLDRLKASIGRSYFLEFDQHAAATSVISGPLEN